MGGKRSGQYSEDTRGEYLGQFLGELGRDSGAEWGEKKKVKEAGWQ